MGKTTNISWSDATVNFWWGCTKVGPGCDHCYAESWAKRYGDDLWGVGVPRRKIKGAAKLISKMQREAHYFYAEHMRRRRVFIQSMSDLFDKETPLQWFADAWNEIYSATDLDIQIVTKRISFVEKRLAEIGATEWPEHVGLIISVVNQDEADRDIPRLLALKHKLGIPWVGLSMEPLLGAVDIRKLQLGNGIYLDALTGYHSASLMGVIAPDPSETLARLPILPQALPGVDWVIVGMESGTHARHQPNEYAQTIVDQCQAVGVPVFVKQLSSGKAKPITDIDQFPERLRVRQFPETPHAN